METSSAIFGLNQLTNTCYYTIKEQMVFDRQSLKVEIFHELCPILGFKAILRGREEGVLLL